MVAGRTRRDAAATVFAAVAGLIPSTCFAFQVVALADTRLPGLMAQTLAFGMLSGACVVASGWCGFSLARGRGPESDAGARPDRRRQATIATIGLLAIWTLTWSAYTDHQRRRMATAVEVMTEFVVAVHGGDASSYGLSREDESKLAEVREAIGRGYQVSCPDFVLWSFALVECHASVSGGGHINADVDSRTRRILGVSAWAPSPPRPGP